MVKFNYRKNRKFKRKFNKIDRRKFRTLKIGNKKYLVRKGMTIEELDKRLDELLRSKEL